jgi:PBSX family phage terminase large subunit
MTPLFQEFDPRLVPWQIEAISYYNNFNYDSGILEMLMSGSIGSAKSICASHIIGIHAIKNKKSRQLILRRALKDLKRTLWQTILSHIADIPHAIKEYNKSEMRITLINGSEIIGDSYDSGELEKFRSLELSGVIIEEASESNKQLYDAVKMRIGRLNSVKENYLLCLTNPDEPSHYLYKEFIEKNDKSKKVFYSLTEQNPFLPPWYIENLKKDLDPMMAKRMLQGQWVSIQGQTPYYAYNPEKQFLKNTKYKINPNLPLDFFHDFNIGSGKPMSSGYAQVINGVFHIGKCFIVEGFNTQQIIDEMIFDGCLETVREIRVFGDRNGKNRDSRSNRTDYEIIQKTLQNYVQKNQSTLKVTMHVPNENPPIRARQNIVNAHCLNEAGEVRLYVYQDAAKVDEGLRLTKIKKGSSYQEDDNNDYQHIVSGLGYYIHEYKTHTEKIGTLKPFTGRR